MGVILELMLFSQIDVHSLIRICIPYNTLIWKLKLPLKIKIFLWYLYMRVVLTKDNLARRYRQGEGIVAFVLLRSPYNIFSSFIVILLNLYGGLFKSAS